MADSAQVFGIKQMCSSKTHKDQVAICFICLSPSCEQAQRLFCAHCILLHIDHQDQCLFIPDILIKNFRALDSQKKTILDLSKPKFSSQDDDFLDKMCSSLLGHINKARLTMKRLVRKDEKQLEADQIHQKFMSDNIEQIQSFGRSISECVAGGDILEPDKKLIIESKLNLLPRIGPERKVSLQQYVAEQLSVNKKYVDQQREDIIQELTQPTLINQIGEQQVVFEKTQFPGQWEFETMSKPIYPPAEFALKIIQLDQDQQQFNYYQGCFGISLEQFERQNNSGLWYNKKSVYSVTLKSGLKLNASQQLAFLQLEGVPGQDYKEIHCKVDQNMNLYFREPVQHKKWELAYKIEDYTKKQFYVFYGLIFNGKISIHLK